MREALKLANQAQEHGEVPVGALIIRDNTVIGRGFNQPISTSDPTAHAEIRAIRDASATCENYRLPGATLYVTIEPCTMCVGAIIHSRISEVVYGAPEPRAGMLESHPELLKNSVFNHEFRWLGGVLEDECRTIMQNFFRTKR